MKKWLATSLVLLIILPVLAYTSLPGIAKYVVEQWLLEQGFQKPVFTVEYPSPKALLISELRVEKITDNRVSKLSAGPISINYDPWDLLLKGELSRIEIPLAELDIEMTGAQSAPPEEDTALSGFDLIQLLPEQWLDFAPSKELVIGQLSIHWHGPEQADFRFTGNVYLTQEQLLTRVMTTIDDKAIARTDLILDDLNRMQFNIIDDANTTALTSVGQFQTKDGRVQFSLLHDINLKDTLEIAKRLPLGFEIPLSITQGHYNGTSHISFPDQIRDSLNRWLLSLDIDQDYSLEAQVQLPLEEVKTASLKLSGNTRFNLAAGLNIELNKQSHVSLNQLHYDNWLLDKLTLRLPDGLQASVDQSSDAKPFKLTVEPENLSHPDHQITLQPATFSIDEIDLQKLHATIDIQLPSVKAKVAGNQLPPVTLQGKSYVRWPKVDTALAVSALDLPLHTAISVAANFDKQIIDAQWRLKEFPLATDLRLLAPYLPVKEIPENFSIQRGNYTHNGRFQWFSGRLDGTINHAITELDIHYEQIQLLNTELRSTTYLRGDRIDDKGTLRIKTLAVGLPLENIQIDYRLNKIGSPHTIADVSTLSAQLLEGTLSAEPFYTVLSDPNLSTNITLRELSLNALLQLERQPGLSGEGILDVNLPLRLNHQGFRITGGALKSRGPGMIRYQPDDDIKALATNNTGLSLALDALSNFRYRVLNAEVNYAPNGELLLKTQLSGENPDWNNGQAVNFSVNIQENVLKLLKTLQFADNLTESIEKRYRKP